MFSCQNLKVFILNMIQKLNLAGRSFSSAIEFHCNSKTVGGRSSKLPWPDLAYGPYIAHHVHSIPNNNNLNIIDNKLLHVTTAVDPWYQLSAFPSYLKNNIKEQLKFIVKKHISFEADQKGDSSVLSQKKPKPQLSVNFDPKKFSTYYFCLK